MAYTGTQYTVGTTITKIAQTNSDGASILIVNRGANPAFLGSSDVTAGTGAQLDAGEGREFTFEGATGIWAITASSTTTLHVEITA